MQPAGVRAHLTVATRCNHEANIKNFSRTQLVVMVLAIITLKSSGQVSSTPSQVPDAQQIMSFLNQTIDWYRHIAVEEQLATDSSSTPFLNNDRQIAKQIVQLAFDFSRTSAQFLANKAAGAAQVQTSEPGNYQSLFQAAAAADEELHQTQAEFEADKKKLLTAHSQRRELQSTIDELQSEIELAQTRSQMLHSIMQFVSGTGATGSTGSLLEQIDQLERSTPELEGNTTRTTDTNVLVTSAGTDPGPKTAGILNLVEDIFALHRKISTLDQTIQLTDAMAQSSKELRSPFIKELTATAQRGEEIAKQADTSNPAQLQQLKGQLDVLTANFKQISSIALPLGKQSVLFDVYKSNLLRWRSAIKDQYNADLRGLILRMVIFGIIIVTIVTLAEVWRKATFRYIHDLHRRYQFLLLRRIVLWCAIAITIAFALATEIGSLATFAGLITAGIAVALQNVILAVAGYFFLIGKYGVRVGDRVQISGVTGDVVDIGLVRLHLMEVGGSWGGNQLTGRMVVFSNAVVFQPNVSFFKQIPGTNLVWRQLSLSLASGSDYAVAKKRTQEAVESVFADYREKIERQHEQMERMLSVAVVAPRPQSLVRLTQNGLEVVVKYPVDWENTAEIDDRMVQELLKVIEQSPELKLAGSGIPDVGPASGEKAA